MAQWLTNPKRNHEVSGSIPSLALRVKDLALLWAVVSSDPALLWLWCRPMATAPIRPLAWELPYASGVAIEKAKRPKKKKKKKKGAADKSSAKYRKQWPSSKCLLQKRQNTVYIFSFGRACGMWNFLGQGSNSGHSCDPKPLQWQHTILNTLYHKGTPSVYYFIHIKNVVCFETEGLIWFPWIKHYLY